MDMLANVLGRNVKAQLQVSFDMMSIMMWCTDRWKT
jgi:hypothetical protein